MNKAEQLVKEGGYRKDFLAEKLKISPGSLTNRLKGRNKWRSDEIKTMKELYSLTDAQTVEIFLS